MHNIIVASACSILLVSGGAAAADKPKGTAACDAALIRAEEMVNQRIEAGALSEADEDKVNMLLDEADGFCTDGKTDKVTDMLAEVAELLAAKQ